MSCALSSSAVTSGTSRTDSHRTDSCHLQIWPQNWHFSAKKANVFRGDRILNFTELNEYRISRVWSGAVNICNASTTDFDRTVPCHCQIWPQYFQFSSRTANALQGDIILNWTVLNEYLLLSKWSGSAVTSDASTIDSEWTDSCHLQIWTHNWQFSPKPARVQRGDGILNCAAVNEY
jgi:hypothetical protein